MSMTPLVQPHHLSRKAVLYIRQSTGHQVLTNTESQQLQHAMREHAHHLGWPDEHIEVVETDQGRTAQSTERRDGYKEPATYPDACWVNLHRQDSIVARERFHRA